ncbi:tripartite tricarboxylate transporter permease [Microbispora sp. CA-102843]|uniref:tripartite tricarboxylate transporter permease n=1 Tax=Microbispora sp. CA-102843 TaxID=3239952 RepID=UPI003D9139E7
MTKALSAVGQDPVTDTARLAFGSVDLLAGLDFVALAMGVFGLGEFFYNLRHPPEQSAERAGFSSVYPGRKDLRASRWAILRGTVIGSLLGLVPGASGTLSSMVSYAAEKRLAKDPGRFGVTDHPEIFWGVLASMFIGNVVLLVLNLPLVRIFVQLLRPRTGILGAITVLNTGVLGYYMRKYGFEAGPLVLAFILGGVIDAAFRRSLLMSGGDPLILLNRPLSGVILAVAAVLLIFQMIGYTRQKNLIVASEE